MDENPNWVRVDVEGLCVIALTEVRSHVQRVSETNVHWLWAVSALRVALQTFIVGSFGTAAGLESMPPKRAEEFVEAMHDPTKQYPQTWMQAFPDLYNYAKERHQWVPGQKVDDAVTLLNDLRAKLEHFTGAWSIEADGLPDMTREVLSAISDLGWGQARVLPWHSPQNLKEGRDLVADILEDLESQAESTVTR